MNYTPLVQVCQVGMGEVNCIRVHRSRLLAFLLFFSQSFLFLIQAKHKKRRWRGPAPLDTRVDVTLIDVFPPRLVTLHLAQQHHSSVARRNWAHQ
jgi:hypothetical protein